MVPSSASLSGASDDALTVSQWSSSLDGLSNRDNEVAEVLTELETQVDEALKKLGPSVAEIDIDVVLDSSRDAQDVSRDTTDIDTHDGDDGDAERFEGDEWVVVVPRTAVIESIVESVPDQPFDISSNNNDDVAVDDPDSRGATATALATTGKHEQQAPHTSEPSTAAVAQLWPAWAAPGHVDDDWGALLAPTWDVNYYRSFGQRQLLGPPNMAMLTLATAVAMMLVLGVWSLSRRTQRRRAIERQTQWAASIELLDAFPHFGDTSV